MGGVCTVMGGRAFGARAARPTVSASPTEARDREGRPDRWVERDAPGPPARGPLGPGPARRPARAARYAPTGPHPPAHGTAPGPPKF